MDSSLRPDARLNKISRQLLIDKSSSSKYSHLTSFPQQYGICTQKKHGKKLGNPQRIWSVFSCSMWESNTTRQISFSGFQNNQRKSNSFSYCNKILLSFKRMRSCPLLGNREYNDMMMIMTLTRLSRAQRKQTVVMLCGCDILLLILLLFNE